MLDACQSVLLFLCVHPHSMDDPLHIKGHKDMRTSTLVRDHRTERFTTVILFGSQQKGCPGEGWGGQPPCKTDFCPFEGFKPTCCYCLGYKVNGVQSQIM